MGWAMSFSQAVRNLERQHGTEEDLPFSSATINTAITLLLAKVATLRERSTTLMATEVGVMEQEVANIEADVEKVIESLISVFYLLCA